MRKHPDAYIREFIEQHAALLGQTPECDREALIHRLTVAAYGELSELIAAQRISDAIEADANKRAFSKVK